MNGLAVDDTHVECVSDFCGNHRSPGHWADVFERPDGSRYVGLGGDWEFYHEHAPSIIEQTDARYDGFLAACLTGDDIKFIRDNFGKDRP